MRIRWSIIQVIIMLTAASVKAADGAVQLDLSHIGDALHLEFSGVKDWSYDLKPNGTTKVLLRVPALKLETAQKLKQHKDALVEKVAINENGLDGKTEITFQITGKTDFFDYLTEQPSKLIIDFFPKEPSATAKADDGDDEDSAVQNPKAKPVAKVLPPKKVEKRKPAGGDFVLVAKNDAATTAKIDLKPADEKVEVPHGIFDGGDPDFSRFSIKDYEIRPEAIKEARLNFYLPFPMLDLGAPELRNLIMTPPTYAIVPTADRENQEARIVLKLYEENKPALLMKTAQEFLKTHSESQYKEIIQYLIADTHYNLWRAEKSFDDFEIALNLYLKLTEKYPQSPVTPRTLLLIGYSYLTRGDAFAAIKSFQHFARISPQSKHIDQTKIATASAYLLLNRFDDAFGILDELEKNGKTPRGREEAAFRKGDVYFRKKDYEAAIAQYEGAEKRFPAAANRFPNAGYNVAEARFNLQKYRESLEAYGKFLKKFPDHDHGGFAMTRMGELLGILGADSRRAEGAFLESYFRYRATPGAGVARIRMLASRISSMKEKELENAVIEMREIAKKYENRPVSDKELKKLEEEKQKLAKAEAEAPKEGGGEHGGAAKGEHHEVDKKEEGFKVAADPNDDATKKAPELPGIEEFTTLLIADGISDRDEFDKAAKDLIAYFQKNPQSPNKNRILARIQRNMIEAVHSAVDRGDFLEALRRYDRESDGWLKQTERVDLPFYVGEAYEQAGVYKEAANVYASTLKQLQTRKLEDLPLREKTPKVESLNLRMAVVAVKEKNFAAAETQLKRIKETSRLSEPEQIEYAEVAADVSEARGQAATARKYLTDLIKTWKGDPRLTAPLHLRIARIASKNKDYKDASQHLETIMKFQENGDYMPNDVHAQALELQGDMDVARGKRKEGTAAYQALLETYEAKRPLSSVRYRLGQVLYEDGDMKGAEKAWAGLNAERDNIWYRLAAEEMQGAKWQKEYKKYINRIPAAAGMRASKN